MECKILFDSFMKFRKSAEHNSNESVPVYHFSSEAVDSTCVKKKELNTIA